jgi:hypothetical protein
MHRFFAEDSFWNTPIPTDARPDPRSDHLVKLLAREPSGGLHLNLPHYTIPVYEVDETTPLRRVRQRVFLDAQTGKPRTWGGAGRTFSHGAGFDGMVPIPDYAVPDPADDGHAAFVDWGRGVVWDIFAARILPDGDWESLTGMKYAAYGRGWWHPADFPVLDGESIHFHGPGRAAGVPIVAGLVMHEEALAGEIRHKLAFACRYSGYKEFVSPPAAWTDGQLVAGLPEGAVIQLDPDLDLGRLDLPPAARSVARAMQTYGMVNTDWAAANAVYVQGLYYDGAPRWEGLLDEWDLRPVPVERLRVLKMDNVIPKGDARTRGAGVTDPAELEKRR